MTLPFQTSDDIIRSTKGVYTFDEAIGRMKLADSLPTGNLSFHWKRVSSGKPVSIGYNDSTPKIKKQGKSKYFK